ncbi:hypothetical protein DACRYDRAFT_118813 [Dacryopinax primogenitus]|uniref:Thioredoxin-like fold domain-containing protein n=1 Tax=Dacryopinax primogenitus (strain DJM 731) TaxID=1858805 RepID=M5FX34_DACPD|nr:uncharacterized protein DACRYDRAFT_118813 [Dacryopinax primogenitus]EJT98031.1 hypothetical protein DACRYDRAFT_118813 [Dacryopinax primogenitus]
MPLKLHNFGEPPSIPKQSFFCQKLETYFRAAGYREYVTVASLPSGGPKGKLPFVTLEGGEKLADSHWAVRELVRRGMVRDLDAGLSEEQKMDTRVWQSYIEDTVFPANVVTRYGDDTNWATFVSEALGKIPFLARAPLAYVIRRGALGQLWARGTGRYTKPQIRELLDDAIRNIELKVGQHSGEGAWFVFSGEGPTSIDVVLYSWLVCVLCTGCNPVQREGVVRSERLRRWVFELTKLWFPEYEGILAVTGDR